MAGTFSLNKVLGIIKNLLGSMDSPVPGFNMQDVKINTKGDVFSALFSIEGDTNAEGSQNIFDKEGKFITDLGGNIINMHILMQVSNAKTVLNPIFSGLNKLGIRDEATDKQSQALIDLLLGTDRDGDNTYDGARERGKDGSMKGGLLGVDFRKALGWPDQGLQYAGQFWSWKKIIEELLKYNIECQAESADYGAIENVAYNNISNVIGEYLEIMQIIVNRDEVNVSERLLVLPIAELIQAKLAEYFNAAYAKYVDYDFDEGEDKFNTEDELKAQQKQTEEAAKQQEAREQMTKNLDKNGFPKQNPNSEAVNPIRQQSTQTSNITPGLSKHIDVTLKKITASSDIEMLALDANYLPSEVLSDLEDVMDQDDFIATVTEDPQTYAISVDDDGFDIEQCGCCKECDPCASLCEVFKSGIRAYRNLYILHWMSSGNDMMKLHNLSEEMYDELRDEIDTVGELLVEKQCTVPQLDFECDYIPVQPYDFQTGLDHIKSLVQMYIDCIDYAYCNQDSDVQSTLDEWLRHWNKQLNYFVKGQET